MFLKIGVKKVGFESGKGFDFLNSEIAMRRAALQECGMVFLHNVRGVHSQDIFQSHINIDLSNMNVEVN
jgi:hypothetical protein